MEERYWELLTEEQLEYNRRFEQCTTIEELRQLEEEINTNRKDTDKNNQNQGNRYLIEKMQSNTCSPDSCAVDGGKEKLVEKDFFGPAEF